METKVRSVFVRGLLWHDRTDGNTYFAVHVHVNGKWLFTEPFQYGYESMFEQKAGETLVRLGVIPANIYRGIASTCRDLGVDYYCAASFNPKRDLAKNAGVNAEFLAQLLEGQKKND